MEQEAEAERKRTHAGPVVPRLPGQTGLRALFRVVSRDWAYPAPLLAHFMGGVAPLYASGCRGTGS